MKATQEQYEQGIVVYEQLGQAATEAFADALGIDEYAWCEACECHTPLCDDGACFVCGSNHALITLPLKVNKKD